MLLETSADLYTPEKCCLIFDMSLSKFIQHITTKEHLRQSKTVVSRNVMRLTSDERGHRNGLRIGLYTHQLLYSCILILTWQTQVSAELYKGFLKPNAFHV